MITIPSDVLYGVRHEESRKCSISAFDLARHNKAGLLITLCSLCASDPRLTHAELHGSKQEQPVSVCAATIVRLARTNLEHPNNSRGQSTVGGGAQEHGVVEPHASQGARSHSGQQHWGAVGSSTLCGHVWVMQDESGCRGWVGGGVGWSSASMSIGNSLIRE